MPTRTRTLDVDEIEIDPARLDGARRPLEKATTLPAEAFTSESIYQLETERLFSREWLCAGRVDMIPMHGDYFCLDLLGHRLVAVRGQDEAIHVLSRICRHRAAQLVEGSGNTKSFQCPYHAWTYRLDGRLLGAPLMDDVEEFDRKTCRLPEIRHEVWEGWIFVNLGGEAAPMSQTLAPLSKLLSNYAMSEMVAIETAIFDSPFNWKVLVDNFMEAYHHIAIHRNTLEPLFPAAMSKVPDSEGPYSVLIMPGKETSRAISESPVDALPAAGHPNDEERGRLVAVAVYPFHLFAPTAESLTWYQILPERFDRFSLRIYTCFPRATLEDDALRESVSALQEFVKVIHNEDIGACEAAWAGLSSGSFEAGRLSPLEKTIWQFNQWWIERMSGAS